MLTARRADPHLAATAPPPSTMEDGDIPEADWEAYDPAAAHVAVDPARATGTFLSHLSAFRRAGGAPASSTFYSADRRTRVQVLSARLVRVEHARDSRLFEDRPTFCFVRRGEAAGCGEAVVEGVGLRGVRIVTPWMVVNVDPAAGEVRGGGGLRASLVKGEGGGWAEAIFNGGASTGENGDDGDLGGTCRTLDEADGFARREWGSHRRRRDVRLGNGLLSRRAGIVFVDDTSRPLFSDDGWFEERKGGDGYVDCYALASGTDYVGALREFVRVAGEIPMVPRAYLGNWWSRYHAYTEDELKGVVMRFQEHGVPLSMCIIGTLKLATWCQRLLILRTCRILTASLLFRVCHL